MIFKILKVKMGRTFYGSSYLFKPILVDLIHNNIIVWLLSTQDLWRIPFNNT